MPTARTRHVVFLLGAAVAIAAPLAGASAQRFRAEEAQQQNQEEEGKRQQQRRQQGGDQQQQRRDVQQPGAGQPRAQQEERRGGGDDGRGRGDDDRRRAQEERRRDDDDRRRAQDDRRRDDDAKRRADEDRRRGEDAKRRADEDRRRDDDAKRRADDDRRRGDDAKKRADEDRRRDDDSKKRADEDRRRDDDAKKRADEDRRRDDDAKRRADENRRRDDDPKKRADEDRRRDDDAKKRAEDERRRDEDDKRRADDERRRGGPALQSGQDDDRRRDRDRDGDRDRERLRTGSTGNAGDRFEAFRPTLQREEVQRRREERREFTKENLRDVVRQRRERREDGRVVIEEPDNRRIIRGEGGAFIRHDETARFRGNGRNFRVEKGPGNQRLTIVERPGGVRVVTVVDEDGRLIRRVRRGPDGREFVLIDNRDRDHGRRRGDRRRGGFGFYIDLPPPIIRIPRERYYVYADRASYDDIEYALSAPPVEEIDDDYTLDEIRYSPRLRERMPSVNLNTINFEFGSWEIGEGQIQRLEVIAKALEHILRRNPDEVFLIEGHTDAVGSDEDNLSLSDRRAETVARVLTDEFGIPPENLVTQGYGEQYLLVKTESAEAANRRVEFRRITPLLSRGDDNESARR